MRLNFLLPIVAMILLFVACKNTPTETETPPQEDLSTATEAVMPNVPDWHKNANIYEVNLRHYTPEGTFAAFQEQLPRLKKMGVDILWLMPIHPISEEKRKGELGSPYAVDDYRAVNPDYGTMDDFKNLLNAVHAQGMYLIIDWVPNHTGWGNPWITEHPDWYTQNDKGEIIDPIDYNTGKSWGWTDVADLNYDNTEMRKGMIEAMAFWTRDIGIDGFRVDVAHGVPVDFWEEASTALYSIKPTFMLAEAEVPALLNTGAYIMDYGWEMHHLLNEIAKTQGANRGGKKLVKGNVVEGSEEEVERKTALDIDKMLAKKDSQYDKGYQMQFTSNHDENSWSGTEFARMGDGHQAFAVLTATFDGMPLIYTGQESAMDKQLEFFKKDEIEWGNYEYADFYQKLFDLKHRNQALWNGEHGGELVKIPTGNDENIYAFTREKNGDKVVVIINLSADNQLFTLQGDNFKGKYINVFSGGEVNLDKSTGESNIPPWNYLVFSNK